jgi:hypothetical protein
LAAIKGGSWWLAQEEAQGWQPALVAWGPARGRHRCGGPATVAMQMPEHGGGGGRQRQVEVGRRLIGVGRVTGRVNDDGEKIQNEVFGSMHVEREERGKSVAGMIFLIRRRPQYIHRFRHVYSSVIPCLYSSVSFIFVSLGIDKYTSTDKYSIFFMQ